MPGSFSSISLLAAAMSGISSLAPCGRDRGDAEPEAAGRREVCGKAMGRAVIREGGQIVSTPQREKLRTRRKGNGSRGHQGIARHPGLAVRSMARRYSPYLHSMPPSCYCPVCIVSGSGTVNYNNNPLKHFLTPVSPPARLAHLFEAACRTSVCRFPPTSSASESRISSTAHAIDAPSGTLPRTGCDWRRPVGFQPRSLGKG
jgi:hypothetical protein